MNDIEKTKDEDLVQKIQSGDKELYSVIIDRYESKLLRYARHLINDEQKAIDVVQESFIKTFVNLNSFNRSKKFSSWIYRITHNEAMNMIKKHKKEIPLSDEFDFGSEENIEKDFEDKETTEMIQKCLKSIPLIYSEPLNLFFIEEKSYEEISDILKIPMGTVATRISRAKIIMKKICQTN